MFWKYLMCPKAVCIWQKYSKNNNSVKYYIWCLMILQKIILIWKWKWHDVTYSQVWWPILGIRALHLTHPKCTHTAVNTHTHTHTHTVNTHPEQWAAIYAAAPGEQLGVRALLKGTSVVVLRVERALYIHSPHLQFLPDQDSNSQPFDYKSDSLTHWSQTQFLEGHSSAQICSNPNQTHLIQLIKVFRITTKQVWVGAGWS